MSTFLGVFNSFHTRDGRRTSAHQPNLGLRRELARLRQENQLLRYRIASVVGVSKSTLPVMSVINLEQTCKELQDVKRSKKIDIKQTDGKRLIKSTKKSTKFNISRFFFPKDGYSASTWFQEKRRFQLRQLRPCPSQSAMLWDIRCPGVKYGKLWVQVPSLEFHSDHSDFKCFFFVMELVVFVSINRVKLYIEGCDGRILAVQPSTGWTESEVRPLKPHPLWPFLREEVARSLLCLVWLIENETLQGAGMIYFRIYGIYINWIQLSVADTKHVICFLKHVNWWLASGRLQMKFHAEFCLEVTPMTRVPHSLIHQAVFVVALLHQFL